MKGDAQPLIKFFDGSDKRFIIPSLPAQLRLERRELRAVVSGLDETTQQRPQESLLW